MEVKDSVRTNLAVLAALLSVLSTISILGVPNLAGQPEAGTVELADWEGHSPGEPGSLGLASSGSSSSPKAPAVQPMGDVAQTLVINNGSLLPGNFLPSNCFNYANAALVPPLNQIYVSCQPDSVVVLNATTGVLVKLLNVGSNPRGLAYDNYSGILYVVNHGSNNVTIVTTGVPTVAGTIPVGGGPLNITFDWASRNLYISDTSGNVTVVSTLNESVATVIPLNKSSQPGAIAFGGVNRDVYVAETGSNAIGVIATVNNSIVTSIPVGGQPSALGFDPVNGDIYAGVYRPSKPSDLVSVISSQTQRVLSNVTPGFLPDAIASDSNRGLVFVANLGSNNLTVINDSMQAVVGSIAVGTQPDGLAVDDTSMALYVADASSSNVAVLNTATMKVTGFLSQDSGPSGVVVDSISNLVYASNWFTNSIAQVSGATDRLVYSIPAPWYSLGGIVLNGSQSQIYATCESCAQVFETGVAGNGPHAISVGQRPTSLAFDDLNKQVFATNFLSNSVSVIDSVSNTLKGTIPIPGPSLGGGGPQSLAFDRSNGNLYVAIHGNVNFNPGNITIINASAGKIIGAIYLWTGPGPSSVAVDNANNELYVTDDYSNVLWAFNLTTDGLVSSTKVGLSPGNLVYDPLNGYLYVTNHASSDVTVVNTTTNSVVGSIHVGQQPNGAAFDPENGNIYVANGGSGTISVISGAFERRISFMESGLPSGTVWWVNVSGQGPRNATGTAISMNLPAGTYVYAVSTANKSYWASGGTLVVNVTTSSVMVSYSELTYGVNFVETGLPNGLVWWVIVSGNTRFTGGGSSISFAEPNGTYQFTLGATDASYTSPGGRFTSSGGDTKNVVFTKSHVATGNPWWLGLIVGVLVAGAATSILVVVHLRPWTRPPPEESDSPKEPPPSSSPE